MIKKIPNSLIAFICFAFTTLLYWPAMHGEPVWDDLSFMFHYEVITGQTPYSTILRDFGWPIGVIIQKFLYTFWGKKYFYYHLLNLVFHFFNSWLMLKIAQKLKLPFAWPLFLLFLFHPSNVISVAWIIQFKTLICFTFALLSFSFFLKTQDSKKWFSLSWLFFALSITSKSSSIPLAAVFVIYYFYQKPRFKNYLWLVPFILLSSYGTYRILNSAVTAKAVESFKESKPSSSPSVAVVHDKNLPLMPKVFKEHKRVSPLSRILSTTHYYFWQSLIPLDNAPIKGLNQNSAGVIEFLHIFFLAIIVWLNRKRALVIVLACGHIMLSPFTGGIAAPYMNIAWVSDQHMYLILPFFISFWLMLVELLKVKGKQYLYLLILPLFFYAISVATPAYKNEVEFYKASLLSDALNVPVAYNLAVAYLIQGEKYKALDVTTNMFELGKVFPEIRGNPYYPYIFLLHQKLKGSQ